MTYYLAVAKHQSGDCEGALVFYSQAETQIDMGQVVSALTHEKVQAKAAKAQECVEQKASAAVTLVPFEIRCAEPEVTLELQGEQQKCPYSGELEVGAYKVTATRAGAESIEVVLELKKGAKGALEIPRAKRLDVEAPQVPPVVEPGRSGMAIGGWVAVGAGTLLLGGAGVLQLMAEGERGTVADAPGVEYGGQKVVESMTQVKANTTLENADGLQTLALLGLGAGAAILATGVVLLLLDDSGEETTDSSVGVLGVVTPNQAALVWVGRF